MGYVGTAPLSGDYRKLDDISSSFNGSTTDFTLQVGSANVTPPKETTMLISVGGILQEPVSAYTVSGSTLTFTAAPATGADFFGILLGDTMAIGTPSDATITGAKLATTLLTGLAATTTVADADLVLIDDAAGGTLRKMTRAHFIESAALDAINIDGGAIDAVTLGTNSAITQAVIDNININGTTIGHTSDTDLLTFGSAVLTIAGSIELGHASDTTIARSASGTVTIEDSVIKTAGTETIWVPATSMVVSVNAPSAGLASIDSGDVNTTIPVLDFDGGSSDEVATFNVAFPKSWNAGTVTARFFWTNSNANAGNVVWGLQGICVVDSGALNGAMTDAGEVIQDANITTSGDVMVTSSTPAVTINGAADDGVTFFNVFRDASDTTNDTYASDARLIGVQVFFTTDAANDA